ETTPLPIATDASSQATPTQAENTPPPVETTPLPIATDASSQATPTQTENTPPPSVTITGFRVGQDEVDPGGKFLAQAGDTLRIEVLLEQSAEGLTFSWTTSRGDAPQPIEFFDNPNFIYTVPTRTKSDIVTVEIMADGELLAKQSIVVNIR
ncbi:MAG: hypothetical protein MI924_14600, partial [Chloroflexales bacterium]|nr:hypothetical protein [Chloroflexales bacterium]